MMLLVGVDVSFIVVIKQGCIDVGMMIELMVFVFEKMGDVKVLVDLCMLDGMCVVFGGIYLVVSLYVQLVWVDVYKVEVIKFVYVFVKMMQFIYMYSVEEIVVKMLVDYQKDKVLYVVVLKVLLLMYMVDGKMLVDGLVIVLKVLLVFNLLVKGKYIDLVCIYMNDFVNVK